MDDEKKFPPKPKEPVTTKAELEDGRAYWVTYRWISRKTYGEDHFGEVEVHGASATEGGKNIWAELSQDTQVRLLAILWRHDDE